VNDHDLESRSGLTTLMHAAVDDVHPDVDRLFAVSVREGTRIRRRRALGYAGAGLAVAAIASVGAATLGLPGGTTATDVASGSSASTGPAPTPTPTPTTDSTVAPALKAGQTLALGDRVVGTVVSCAAGEPDRVSGNPACILPARYQEIGSSTVPGAGTGFAVVLTGPDNAVDAFWSHGFQSPLLVGYDGLSYALRADSPLIAAAYDGQDVTIHVAGWKQVGQVADDKQSLTGPGGKVGDIVWRPASDYDAWMAGEKNDPATWTSPVHDGVFVTIQGGLHTTDADVQALGASLTWD
jgi:hypothetical protein